MDWRPIVADPNKRIKQALGATTTREENYRPDYVSVYSSDVNPIAYDDARRNYDESLSDCTLGSSLFIFGGGSSVHPNFYKRQGRFSRVISTDIVEQACTGLDPDVEFRLFNILTDEFPETFDYIFSSHTVEHFTRDEIMGTILPKCLAAARQAVIFLTPWKDLGWGAAKAEGPHIVELCEDDELAAHASKWKRVRDNPSAERPDQLGLELILWFEGQANGIEAK